MTNDTQALVPAAAPTPPVLPDAGGAIEINVNGRNHLIDRPEISHEQLVQLAYPNAAADRSRSFAVLHRGAGASAGTLAPRQRTRILPGLSFDVHVADKS